MNRQLATILTVVMGGSLLLNWMTLNRIGQLEQRITQLNNNQYNIQSMVSSQIQGVRDHLSDMAREQRWLASAQWRMDATGPQACQSPIPLTLDFALRELAPNQEVGLEVRPADSSEWRSVPISQSGSLAYTANLELEPLSGWQYRVVSAGAGGSQASEAEPIHLLERLRFRAPFLTVGEEFRTSGQRRVRFLVENKVSPEDICSQITEATLLIDRNGKAEQFPMSRGYTPTEPPIQVGTGGSGSGTRTETSRDLDAWWSDWLDIDHQTESQVKVQLRFGDGQSMTLGLHEHR